MMLLDVDEVRRIHRHNLLNPNGPTEYRFTPGERPLWLDSPDMFETERRFHPGPYLLSLNDEIAYISRDGEWWEEAAPRRMYPCVEQAIWEEYASKYAEHLGIPRRSLIRRFSVINNRLSDGVARPWEEVYTWDEGSDDIWVDYTIHPSFHTTVNQCKEIRRAKR